MTNLSFDDRESMLRVRISAHKRFTTIKLEDWMANWLGRLPDQATIVEVGCGDGNYFEVYAAALPADGRIIGLDRSAELLAQARATTQRLARPCSLLEWDFNNCPWPLSTSFAQILLAPFSAYYAADVEAWIAEAVRVLSPGGRMLLLGPT